MKKSFFAIVCTCLLMPATGFAANMRDYIPAPPDTLLSLLYYHHISADNFGSSAESVGSLGSRQVTKPMI